MKRDTRMQLARAQRFAYSPSPATMVDNFRRILGIAPAKTNRRSPKMFKPMIERVEWRVTPKLLQRERRGLPLCKGERDALAAARAVQA